jgi:hypothetical protein
VAVNSRRRHQRGEAVEQLERGQALRATATGARFRGVVDEVLAIALAMPRATHDAAIRRSRAAKPWKP